MRTINEYKIEKFIFSITFDNASANNSAIEILKMQLEPMFSGNFFHVRCVCHILNLCVKDGLKIIDPHLRRVRDGILFAKNSSIRRYEFKRYCKQMGKKYNKFISDVPHRWNSTYAMLECAYDYKDILTIYCNEHFPEIGLTSYDWDVSYIIKEFLEIFNMATNFFSGVYYPTTFVTIKQLYYISEIFLKYRNDLNFASVCCPYGIKI